MKKSSIILTVIVVLLGAGILYVDDRRESQHHEEYLHHVSNAFSNLKMADQSVKIILENWEQKSPMEIANSLLSISSTLNSTEIEMSSLEGYLRYHDNTSSGGSTSFLSNLFRFYKDSVDTRLRGTWQHLSPNDQSKSNEIYWISLQQDLVILQRDFDQLLAVDKGKFEQAQVSDLHNYWLSQTSRLQFQEVTKRFHEFEGVQPSTR